MSVLPFQELSCSKMNWKVVVSTNKVTVGYFTSRSSRSGYIFFLFSVSLPYYTLFFIILTYSNCVNARKIECNRFENSLTMEVELFSSFWYTNMKYKTNDFLLILLRRSQ